jgi:hypothetical protein
VAKPRHVACADEKHPLRVEAVARIAIGVPMKGLSANATTTPTNVPVAAAMETESACVALTMSQIG